MINTREESHVFRQFSESFNNKITKSAHLKYCHEVDGFELLSHD